MWNIDQIYTNLFQGACPPPGGLVATKGFQALVLAAEEHQQVDLYPGVHVILAPGDDDDRPHRLEQFLPTWLRAAEEVAHRVKDGQKVLVTCMAGLNRSGFITAVALHHLTGWSGEACVKWIQRRRRNALCNETFVKYLRENIKPKETIT